VSRAESGPSLCLDVRFPDPRALLFIVERVRRLFDLGADPAVIAEHLRADPLLRKPLAGHSGIRVPGAWDGFELAVRAILGQQVSVRAATTIAGRLASMFGTPVADARGLSRVFPAPAQLTDAPLERAGVMPARAAAIRTLARQVADRRLGLGPCIDGRATIAALRALPGIGDWTAEYIAMRALGEPDAFPRGDLVLRRLAGGLTARALDRRSDAWRPWRAYAAMVLWQRAVDDDERTGMRRFEAFV
jgi:AraC family transcriptional regulator of adaptative response / DNA-3-methyladenine glycosylase II